MTASSNVADTAPSLTDLHAAIRKWTEHVPQNLPYVDLMFAFGHATIGEQLRAVVLLEDARKLMVVPIPSQCYDQSAFDAVISAVASNFLFKAFQFRINQAIAGKPHTGPLSAELHADLDDIRKKGQVGGTNNPYLRVDHVVSRLRVQSRIVEPTERIDPYAAWTKNQDALRRALSELDTIHESGKLADRIRELYRKGVPGKNTPEVQLIVLHETLPLARRVGQAFAVELLKLVPATLAAGMPAGKTEPPDFPRRQGELLERAFLLAANSGSRTEAAQLADSFLGLIQSKSESTRFNFINIVARQCFASLQALGLNAERDRVLAEIQNEATRGIGATTTPEILAVTLQTRLHAACGLLLVGRRNEAAPIFTAARHELIDPNGAKIAAREFTALGQTYLMALGETTREPGLASMIELFREMNPRKITNTWTTAQYFSRFHLELVEDAVLAACRLESDQPLIVQA